MDITKEQLITLIQSYGLFMFDYAEAIYNNGDQEYAHAKTESSLKYIISQINKIK